MTLIRPATTPDDLSAVRALCWGYREHLLGVSPIDAQITETFYPVPKYEALMDKLDAEHARPNGIILLAEVNGEPAACVMTHALDHQTSEIKRLYVAPFARGHGIARKLVTACTEQARSDGFCRTVLDTSVSLTAARRLYESMGFSQRGPYQPIPEAVLPHLLFYEKDLTL
ncbi:GNAT family N-acetyltransferase [uncultured Sulfitobacter sp.]|uniref:GNAT family N-acetyltransferase n=1 Tax=uncultured Sulfitobacter sp. TaxID=191468 RepID=UPI002639B5FB|nr:GNAT family N-acetyltransferase [uncultured Sulfitobacter sp.]